MFSTWENCLLGDVLTLQRGFDLPTRSRKEGNVPVVSSSGITGLHDEAKVKAPGVVTGRYGTLGEIFYIEQDFFPLNTTLYIRDFKGNDPRFISYLLRTLNLSHQNVAAAVPGLNRNDLHLLPVRKPPIATQRKIADILSGYDRLIENNTRRIKILEEMAQLLYREWFVNFRFPGYEKVSALHNGDMKLSKTRCSVQNVAQPTSVETANKKVSRITFAKSVGGSSLMIMRLRVTPTSSNANASKCMSMAWDFEASSG